MISVCHEFKMDLRNENLILITSIINYVQYVKNQLLGIGKSSQVGICYAKVLRK